MLESLVPSSTSLLRNNKWKVDDVSVRAPNKSSSSKTNAQEVGDLFVAWASTCNSKRLCPLHPRDRENTLWNRTKCWIARSDVPTISFGQLCSATNSSEVKDSAPRYISENQGVIQERSKDSQTDKTHRPHNTFNIARSSHARHNFYFNLKQSMTELRHPSSEIVHFCQSFRIDHPIRTALVLTLHLRSA